MTYTCTVDTCLVIGAGVVFLFPFVETVVAYNASELSGAVVAQIRIVLLEISANISIIVKTV